MMLPHHRGLNSAGAGIEQIHSRLSERQAVPWSTGSRLSHAAITTHHSRRHTSVTLRRIPVSKWRSQEKFIAGLSRLSSAQLLHLYFRPDHSVECRLTLPQLLGHQLRDVLPQPINSLVVFPTRHAFGFLCHFAGFEPASRRYQALCN